ncbi:MULTISPECIES: hypothetical protein [Streptomyces]|uniref:hypothetical protein n=1 Tax=Streptomyces TaxID=1883 RepID=UPI002034AA35|nr:MULTISPECIES: hypothetical protein [Streptomyces]UUA10836.1 hypothetical protein NNW98_37120 [Streptomyces koelreuteriae]UUA18442.1 hypothetical protein NNW99_37005 [Streptomyces sp. CRCS-T-1]
MESSDGSSGSSSAAEGRDRAAAGPPLNSTEREEYERLRTAASVHHRRLRYSATSVLLILTFLLAPLAVVAAWVDSEVADTDRYVQTVAPIATEPSVQNTVTDRLTKRVVDNVDVAAFTDAVGRTLQREGAPPRVVQGADALTGPLTSALTSAVHSIVHRVVTSDQFAEVWDDANRRAHAAVVKVLTGEGGSAVQAGDDSIDLNIGTVVDNVKQRLVDAGFDQASKIPDVDKTITLFQTDKLNEAQGAMRLLNILGVWLPVLVLVLAALAVWSGPAHRVALMTTAIGIGVMMIVLLVGLAVMRQIYLDSVATTALPQDTAADIYDIFLRFLKNSTVTVLVIAVITALAAYLYGPGRGARWIRRAATGGTGATGRAMARHGMRTGGPGHWLDAHRKWTTGIVIAGGALALVLWNYPTPGSVALVLGIVLLVLILLGILAAASGRAQPSRMSHQTPGKGA